ncbi:hypothetical protein ACO0LV_09955 [Pseudactinotalea sp. Z1739]|uniref:ATP-binding protein n=1 Tax=Pseudactinotalea sp. Z1739 TaxID=3413028 RepID=UPI003C7CAA56
MTTRNIYGLVDSTSYPGSASFQRYTYPSSEPDRVVEQVAGASRKVIQASGLDNSTFNIEFFWDPGTSRLRLLEVNARHSQAHATLFEMVDGVPNHAAMVALGLGRRAMVALGLGRRPHIPDDKGPYPVAAKWFLRHFADGVVRRCPPRSRSRSSSSACRERRSTSS